MKSSRTQAMAEIRAELSRRNEAAGLIIESNVKVRTPVDSGRLRSSYTHDADADGVRVGTNVPYAPPVELGHKTANGGFVPPQPHLVPGFRASIPALHKLYGGEIR